jgi:hypothetical protein
MNELEMGARKRAAAARSRLQRDASEYAAELRALVALAEPSVPPEHRWLIALAVYARAALPIDTTPDNIGAALAAVSVTLKQAADEAAAKRDAEPPP